MAHKAAAGTAGNLGHDSISKRLGVKRFAGEFVFSGNILIRQRGTKFHAGANVKRTADDTLISMTEGAVSFTKKKVRAFTGNLVKRTYINVE